MSVFLLHQRGYCMKYYIIFGPFNSLMEVLLQLTPVQKVIEKKVPTAAKTPRQLMLLCFQIHKQNLRTTTKTVLNLCHRLHMLQVFLLLSRTVSLRSASFANAKSRAKTKIKKDSQRRDTPAVTVLNSLRCTLHVFYLLKQRRCLPQFHKDSTENLCTVQQRRPLRPKTKGTCVF